MNEELYNLTLDLVKEIKDTKEYQELKELENVINQKYYQEIKRFNDAKKKLEALNKYDLDYKKWQKELLESKDVLYHFEEVIKYKRLENKINGMLKEISEEIKELL